MRYHRHDMRYHRDDIRYRRKKRSFPVILICLFLSIALLASSTYAWFSANRIVTTTDLVVKCGTSTELKISADARVFGSTLTYQHIANADYVDESSKKISLPSNFSPISTIGNLNNGYLDLYLGKTNIVLDTASPEYGRKTLTASGITDVDGNSGEFMAFDIYFENNVERTIYLSNRSKVIYTGEREGSQNAIRVAFVFEGESNSGDLALIQSLKTIDTNNVKIWEPNSTTHTAGGIKNAHDNYELEIDGTYDPIDYLGVKAPILSPVLLNSGNPDYFDTPINLMTTPSNWSSLAGDNLELFDFGIGISKVRVYAWIEGQDVDCENEAAGSTFEFDLNFTTNPVAAVR